MSPLDRLKSLSSPSAAALVAAVMALTPACKKDGETEKPGAEAKASVDTKDGAQAQAKAESNNEAAKANTANQQTQENSSNGNAEASASVGTPAAQPSTPQTPQAQPAAQPAQTPTAVEKPKNPMDIVNGSRIKLHSAGTFLPGDKVTLNHSFGSNNNLQDAYNCVATSTPNVPGAAAFGFSEVADGEKPFTYTQDGKVYEDKAELLGRAFEHTVDGQKVVGTAVQTSVGDQKRYDFNIRTGNLNTEAPRDLVKELGVACEEQAKKANEALKPTVTPAKSK